jgi:spermidine synthase
MATFCYCRLIPQSGLGIGTTPAALIAHGIDTTVVEIDPVVYEFASKYFRMPDNHTAIVDDAVGYAASQAQKGEQTYDYIVHDVFTGGAEPIDLFTLEFLTNLERLLSPNGVIAIVSLLVLRESRPGCVADRTCPELRRRLHSPSRSNCGTDDSHGLPFVPHLPRAPSR